MKKQNIKKQILMVFLVAALFLTIFAGCASKASDVSTSGSEPTDTMTSGSESTVDQTNQSDQPSNTEEQPTSTITFWSMLTQKERADQLQKLADTYMQEHPGTKIDITVMPWSGAMDKIVASIMAGNAPDLMTTGTGYPQSLGATGGLLELSDLVQEVGGKDAFLSTSLSVQGAYEDGLYSIPLYITPYIAYYRQSWLDKAGITKLPETWEEYYEMCKAVTNPAGNKYGFGIPLGDLHGWKTIWSFLQSNGVDLINVDQNDKWYVDLNSEDRAAMIETYNYLYKLVKDTAPEGTISYTQTNVREMVAGGTIMSRIDTPEIYYTVQQIDPDSEKDVKYFPIPGRKKTGSGQGWVGLSISKDGNVALAKDFVKYLFTGDTLVDFFLSYPYAMFPAKAELFHNKEYYEGLPDILKDMVPDMALNILATSTSLGMVNGPFPGAGEFEARCILGNGLVKMLSENYTAEQAVEYIIDELEKLM
ncbi:MAG: ABC transporter substrate-binding protein [Bacillota bacterium]